MSRVTGGEVSGSDEREREGREGGERKPSNSQTPLEITQLSTSATGWIRDPFLKRIEF
jgi:hypothetical protein